MSRSPARLSDSKPNPSPERQPAKRVRLPRELAKVELELPDGRYLLAYGYRATSRTDA